MMYGILSYRLLHSNQIETGVTDVFDSDPEQTVVLCFRLPVLTTYHPHQSKYKYAFKHIVVACQTDRGLQEFLPARRAKHRITDV